MSRQPVYLDNNATTCTDPRVVEAMLPFFTEDYGNAASKTHSFGRKAAEAVEQAREEVAVLIGVSPREMVFTSGATESDNLALKGAAAALRQKGNHIITAQTEHRAVLDVCKRLQREGFAVTFLPVDQHGQVEPDQVAEALTDKTILVSLMAANNEIGTLHPLASIGKLCKERNVLLHTDAAQAVGKVPLNVEELGIDLLSLSGHKIYGPKGVGALYVRRRNPHVRLEPQMDGGGHERGLRSGTLPVPLVVGLGRACSLCRQEMPAEAARLLRLRERLCDGIMGRVDGVTLNGHPTERLPNTLSLCFAHVQSEAVLVALRHVAASSGSACTSASVEPSHVLRALGLPEDLARGTLRFGLGRFTTAEEIDFAVGEIVRVVQQLRAISPAYELSRAE
jgi:cysteine desulfurase